MSNEAPEGTSGHPLTQGARASRRALIAGGVVATAALGGAAVVRLVDDSEGAFVPEEVQLDTTIDVPERISPHGTNQQGVATPAQQEHARILVGDLADLASVPGTLDRLGKTISALTSGERLRGLEPGLLTVTVGVGPRIVAEALGEGVPGAQDLPVFTRDAVPEERRGGDLFVQICSDDAVVNGAAETELLVTLESEFTPRWSAQGSRGPADQGFGRNLLGFHDGVTIPRTSSELKDDVWIADPPQIAGSTIAVLRMMPIDVAAFSAMSVAEQERSVGRKKESGAPLSSGSIDDEIDLHAKTSDGAYAISSESHVRRAHPLPAGAPGLMLRRSYSYFNGSNEQGLLFISFQKDLETFSMTQARLDEGDALLDHTSTTASGTFLVLPGFSEAAPLGDSLR